MKAVLALVVVLIASQAVAQGIPTSYVFRVYARGASTASSTMTLQATQVPCNLAPAPAVTENPTHWQWDDLATAGRSCRVDDSARFNALADGSYEVTIQAVNADGASEETPRVPFGRRRPTPPAVPTTPRLTR
jgi:hypothetical protein